MLPTEKSNVASERSTDPTTAPAAVGPSGTVNGVDGALGMPSREVPIVASPNSEAREADAILDAPPRARSRTDQGDYVWWNVNTLGMTPLISDASSDAHARWVLHQAHLSGVSLALVRPSENSAVCEPYLVEGDGVLSPLLASSVYADLCREAAIVHRQRAPISPDYERVELTDAQRRNTLTSLMGQKHLSPIAASDRGRHPLGTHGLMAYAALSRYGLAETTEVLVGRPDLDARYLGLRPHGILDLDSGDILNSPDNSSLLVTRRTAADLRPDARHELCDALTAHLPPRLEEYFWLSVAACLRGPHSAFYHVVGSTNSGKSTAMSAIRTALGKHEDWGYVTALDSSVLAAVTRQAGAATPEKAAMEGARLLVMSEWPEYQKMAISTVKKLTGDDLDSGRGLYADYRGLVVTGAPWLLSNPEDAPHMNLEKDPAMRRRLRWLDYPQLTGQIWGERVKKAIAGGEIAAPVLARIYRAALELVGGEWPPQTPPEVTGALELAVDRERGDIGDWIDHMIEKCEGRPKEDEDTVDGASAWLSALLWCGKLGDTIPVAFGEYREQGSLFRRFLEVWGRGKAMRTKKQGDRSTWRIAPDARWRISPRETPLRLDPYAVGQKEVKHRGETVLHF